MAPQEINETVSFDGRDYPIRGLCDERFQAVIDCFQNNFREGLETGSCIAVTLKGESIIDLWGGFTDKACQVPWEADTIVNMMSVSKAVASICMHILVDRGEIDTTLPIATYWPEFAEAGKGDLPLRFVLDHRAGLPFLEPPLPQGAIYDAQTICQALARLAPMWEPGEEMGYHVMTQGFLVAEVVRRVAGMTLGNFFRQEVAEPLGLDYHIGLPPEHFTRCAGFILPADIPLRYAPANPETPEGRFWAQLAKGEDFNSNGWRSSEIPSANGHGNARATAKLYGVLVSSERLMSRETLQRMASEQHNMVEQFLGRHYHQGLGVVLNSPPVAWMGPNSKFFGHQGAGGSIGYGDPDARIGFSYAMNRMHMPDSGPRDALAKALFACLEG